MPSIADRDHADAIPHEKGAERQLGATDSCAGDVGCHAPIDRFWTCCGPIRQSCMPLAYCFWRDDRLGAQRCRVCQISGSLMADANGWGAVVWQGCRRGIWWFWRAGRRQSAGRA